MLLCTLLSALHRTHVVERNKYIIYIEPKDDWLF